MGSIHVEAFSVTDELLWKVMGSIHVEAFSVTDELLWKVMGSIPVAGFIPVHYFGGSWVGFTLKLS